MAPFKNVFDRQVDRKFTFRGTTRGPDINERVVYEGEVAPAAGGELFTITNVTGHLLTGGKDVGRTLDPARFTGRTRQEVQRKLARALDGVSFTDSGDLLLAEVERDRSQRNKGSAYTPSRAPKRPVQTEPAEKLVFGLKVGDPELGKVFEAACADWVRQHASEFDGGDMTPAQQAVAVERTQANVRSMARLLERWALTGKVKKLTAQEVEDARVWLKQRHRWQPIRRRQGEPIGREYFPEPEPTELAARDPRSMSFEELQQIEKERQRRVRAQKNLHYGANGLGDIR